MSRSPSYFLVINQPVVDDGAGVPIFESGWLQSCESLGIDVVSIRRASMDVDVLEMEQCKVRGAWAVTLAHDADVRLVRQDPVTGVRRQLFAGKVTSPTEGADAGRRRRQIRVHNVMQAAKECLFTRGLWTTAFLPVPPGGAGYPFFPVDDSNNLNGHECTPFGGFNFFTWPYSGSPLTGYKVRRAVEQSVRRALEEWSFNLAALVTRLGYRTGSTSSRVWGANGAVVTALGEPVWPEMQGEQSLSYLDWLIRITQVIPDIYSVVTYAGSAPVVTVGRFKESSPVTITEAEICLGVHVGRQRHDEAEGVIIINQGNTGTNVVRQRLVRARYPNVSTLNLLDRRVVPIDFQTALPLAPDSTRANEIIAEIGALLTGAQWSGSLTLSGGAWGWCRPGSVLQFAGGGRLNVQETVHDLATDSVSVSVGQARHLGQFGRDEVVAWLAGYGARE